MSVRQLSSRSKSQVLRRLSHKGQASPTTLDTLIGDGKLPKDFKWQPSLCIARGDETILVHILASPDFPPYLERAIKKLRDDGFQNVYVLVLARDLMLEATEEVPPTRCPAPYAASAVAEKAMSLGCALAFEAARSVHLVFDGSYSAPHSCRQTGKETGHVPKWLYRGLAASADFSPNLQRLLQRFATDYDRATRKESITNDREAKLLLDFARSFAKVDKRFFLPVEQLETLRQFEMSRATRARDHFFHTFNNLLLGFHVLGQLFSGRKVIAEVDRSIQNDTKASGLNPWEVLWFLTCMFHDPGYTAEKFWANFRFAFGIEADASSDAEIPDQVKEQIRDLWDSKYAAPRQDLHDLYNRTVRKWVPPTIAKKGADVFDEAVRKAYFDGRIASHSLISGLRLINSCRAQTVPRAKRFSSETALTACVIAALCMMFHDPRCRGALQDSGITPIAFESLPYACILMYVDCLQDDRRDISISRFNEHGVLASIDISSQRRTVKAQVCLPEVPIKGWPGRIAEYESVMEWINTKSETKFTIDYRSSAKLPN
jgi:hypothetical protein